MQQELFSSHTPADLLVFEKLAFRQGYQVVAGIDEAGRGPLAGPVVAAAVILPPGLEMPGVNDSKKLTPARREELFALVQEQAVSVAVGIADNDLVDRLNILQATLRAMAQAVEALSLSPGYLLIDGISSLPLNIPQKAIPKGDSLSLSIAAASIIAKVTRDRLMLEYDLRYPVYGFAEHKGYGSAAHLAAILRHGPCPIHRRTFRGVREHLPAAECVATEAG